MTYLKIAVCMVTSLLFGAGIANAEEAGKFDGQFWTSSDHFQLNGKEVLIAEDGIHDPTNITGVYGLQPPVDAMAKFPRDSAGLIDWVQALRTGHIMPRSDIYGLESPLKPIDLDVKFTDTAQMPNVLFSHKAHTEWLTCKNCHPAIFKEKKGSNDIKMDDILNGQYCGVCHGKVAFAPTRNCMRCHSVPKK